MTPGMLPLDTEEWVDDLLTCLFAVLTHLEAVKTFSAAFLKAQAQLLVCRRTPGMLPLDTQAWVADLRMRVFALLTHLEALKMRSAAVSKAHNHLLVRRRTL